jgi:hypothetical protein
MNLCSCRLRLHKYEAALQALERASELGAGTRLFQDEIRCMTALVKYFIDPQPALLEEALSWAERGGDEGLRLMARAVWAEQKLAQPGKDSLPAFVKLLESACRAQDR